jgi:hypothetical protein
VAALSRFSKYPRRAAPDAILSMAMTGSRSTEESGLTAMDFSGMGLTSLLVTFGISGGKLHVGFGVKQVFERRDQGHFFLLNMDEHALDKL